MPNPVSRKFLGFCAATTIVFLWSGWIVATRSGATSPLTIYDIAVLRFGLSGLIALPIILYFKPWRGLSLKRIAVTSSVSGIPYILVVFLAFKLAPAAHGGVFMNGVLPAITLALGWLWYRDVPHKMQLLGAILITVGASMTLVGSNGSSAGTAWQGDLLFMLAGTFFAVYMVLSRLWALTSMQILMCSSVVNGAILTPIWYFFLPSGMADAALNDILLQALYQGILATLFGMLLVAFAVRHIGAPIVAAMMSAVPGFAAMLGYLILGEEFGLMGWISLAILTPGIIMTAVWNRANA
jgi:drug/metabolite transporter (DMT)-like permease